MSGPYGENGNGNGRANGHANRLPSYPRMLPSPAQGDRTPPQNLEAERGVIGGVLLENSHIPGVLALLSAEDFYRDSHQVIYRAIRAIHEAGKPVDFLILANHLMGRGEYEKVGGHEAIVEIRESIPHAANTSYYAQIVKEKAASRNVVEAAHEMLREGYSNTLTAVDLIDGARTRIEAITTEARARPGVRSRRLAEVVAEEIEWLWPGRIAVGKLNMLIGDPSVGKSFLTLAMAAAVTTGSPWPDRRETAAEPGSVVLLSQEDGIADTIRPRADAAGADAGKIHVVTGVDAGRETQRHFSLAADLDILAEMIAGVGDCRLLVVDPISAYLGGVDENKGGDVRGILTPLASMAERLRVAVLLVAHMNKGSGTKAIYRSTGSIGFVGAARMAWMVIKDSKDPKRRLLLPAKNNIIGEPSGLAYKLADGMVQWEAEPVAKHADEALADLAKDANRKGGGKRGPLPIKVAQCRRFVLERLAVGPDKLGLTWQAATEAGFAKVTFYDALETEEVERFEVEGKKWLRLAKAEEESPSEPPATLPMSPHPF